MVSEGLRDKDGGLQQQYVCLVGWGDGSIGLRLVVVVGVVVGLCSG